MNITITEAQEKFRLDNELKSLADETIKFYDTMLNILIRKTGIKNIKQFTQDFVDEYKRKLIKEQRCSASINSHLCAIRRFANYCYEIKLCPAVKVKMIKDTSLPKPTYSDEEIQLVIESSRAEDEDSIIALLLIASGIRSKSLRNMSVSDINFDDETITLRHTKNAHPYILPLPTAVINSLRLYISYTKKKDCDLLFPSATGTKMTREVLWRHITKYLLRIGINKTGVHKFRHSFAKTVCKNGLSNSIMLMRLLGQSTIQQAEHYVNLYGNELRACMTKYNPVK